MSKASRSAGLLRGIVLAAAAVGCGVPEPGDDVGQRTEAVLVGTQMDCPSGPTGPCTARNMPLLWQGDERTDYDVWDMRAGGCYDASIATILTTALANRTTTMNLVGRTRTWNNIAAGNNGHPTNPLTTTKHIEQMSQEYRWSKQHQAGTGVQPLYTNEMLADFASLGTHRRFPTTCNPKTYGDCNFNTVVINNDLVGAAFYDWGAPNSHINDAHIKDLMSRGFSVLIAYSRYAPSAEYDPERQGFVISFSHVGFHKVAFSGYQDGPFPLRVNDVGDGNRYNVTVTDDPLAGGWWANVNPSDVIEYRFPNGRQRQTFIKYDSGGGPEDPNVNLVDHIDAISLGLPLSGHGKVIFSGSWTTGLTTIMPFDHLGEPHQLAYNANTGFVQFGKYFPNAQGVNAVWNGTWGTGFTHIVPYYIGGVPYFLAYNQTTGAIHYNAFAANLQGPVVKAIRTWPTGITSIVPFVYQGDNWVILYNKNTGWARFDLLSPQGDASIPEWLGTWETGWTDFVPHNIADWPYLVAYNSGSGNMQYNYFDFGLPGKAAFGQANLGSGRRLSKLPFAGPANLLFSIDNTITIRRMWDGSSSGQSWGFGTGLTTANKPTLVTSFKQSGKTYTLAYSRNTGAVRAQEVSPF